VLHPAGLADLCEPGEPGGCGPGVRHCLDRKHCSLDV